MGKLDFHSLTTNKGSEINIATKKKYSKYKVDQSSSAKKKRTVYDKHTDKTVQFASNIEKKYYDEVVLPKFKSGEIIDYDLQKKYILQDKFRRPNGELIRAIDYVADYWLLYADGHEEVKDTKGAGLLIDSVAKIKRKMLFNRYPDLDFEWITWSSKTSWINWDKLMKMKREEKKGNK